MQEPRSPFLATRNVFNTWRKPSKDASCGAGALLHADGRTYLDFASGSGALILGHGDAGVAAVMAEQASRLTVHPGSEFHVPVVEQYLTHLRQFAGGGLSRIATASSGSDAVEAALKLALQFQVVRGEARRVRIIGRNGSYHGNTLFGLGVGGFVRRRLAFERVIGQAPKARAASCFHCEFHHHPSTCGVECAESLQEVFAATDPATVAAVIVEPVVGAALSGAVPDDRYLRRVREICDQHGVLLIFDEVLTGFGRTGRAFAWQHWDVRPDILVLGKAMSAGYFPLSGIMCTERIAAGLEEAGVTFENGQTHLFSPLGAAVGEYVLERIEADGLVGRAAESGATLKGLLQPLLGMPHIADVRGLGLMVGVELMRDPMRKVPFEPSLGVSRLFAKLAQAAGLIVYPSTGHPAALAGDHVLLLPPLTVAGDQLREAANCLEKAAGELHKQLR